MKIKKHLFLWAGLLVFAGVVVFGRQTSGAGGDMIPLISDINNRQELKIFTRIISNKLQIVGGQATYAEFKSVYSESPDEVRHLAAHLFGEELFRINGPTGITVCDQGFGFGCFHGFISRAIAQQGPDVARKIDAVCLDKYGLLGLGCPHGIGHGLGEYFGPARLKEQLEVCRKLVWQGTVFGCQGGVYMEYHIPNGLRAGAGKVRKFHEDNPYDPCPQLEGPQRPGCFIELPMWWQQALAGDFRKISGLCGAVTDLEERRRCFQGIGRAAMESSGYDQAFAKSTCGLAPEAVSRTQCLGGAVWSWRGNPESAGPARICEDCEAEADLLK